MSTLTLTPSRFGGSFAGSRETYNSNAVSMADSLPSVDFNFNDLRERMNQFTARFDEFIARGRKRVLEEHNAFKINVAEMKDTQRDRRAAISKLVSKSSSHADILAKEAAEADEMQEAIKTLAERKEEHLSLRDRLKADIASAQNIVKQKREAQAAHQRTIEAQMRHDVPELHFWQHSLGLRIEASGFSVQDQLRFVFTSIEERDPSKEAWFELNMSDKDYVVTEMKPKLEKEKVEQLVEQLNCYRELGIFLKSIRELFVSTMNA